MNNTFEFGSMKVKIYLPEETIPSDVVRAKLSHGTKVVEVVNGKEDLSDTDAMYSSVPSIILGLTTADCAAICMTDGTKVGIAHVGWRGLCAGLVERMLEQIPNPTEIYVNPFLHEFEIKKDFCYEAIIARFGARFISENDSPTFRFKEAVASLLPANAVFDPRNTFLDKSLPSYRRDKTPARMYTTVQLLTNDGI